MMFRIIKRKMNAFLLEAPVPKNEATNSRQNKTENVRGDGKEEKQSRERLEGMVMLTGIGNRKIEGKERTMTRRG